MAPYQVMALLRSVIRGLSVDNASYPAEDSANRERSAKQRASLLRRIRSVLFRGYSLVHVLLLAGLLGSVIYTTVRVIIPLANGQRNTLQTYRKSFGVIFKVETLKFVYSNVITHGRLATYLVPLVECPPRCFRANASFFISISLALVLPHIL